ncbi:MAG: Spo0E like sporulation regulatory protein [Clostridia bacterium]|nr:Spo0E like sporulation regulatory protein [Clostridia bacterium]
MNRKEIINKINRKRLLLHELINKKNALLKPEVLSLSQELDELIVQYYLKENAGKGVFEKD